MRAHILSIIHNWRRSCISHSRCNLPLSPQKGAKNAHRPLVEHGIRGFVRWNVTLDFLLTPLGMELMIAGYGDYRQREGERVDILVRHRSNCTAKQGWPTSASIERGKVKSVNYGITRRQRQWRNNHMTKVDKAHGLPRCQGPRFSTKNFHVLCFVCLQNTRIKCTFNLRSATRNKKWLKNFPFRK